MKEVFTLTEVVRICGVGAHVVRRWCDSGGLTHERLPTISGSPGIRRVRRHDLIAFLRSSALPVPPLLLAGLEVAGRPPRWSGTRKSVGVMSTGEVAAVMGVSTAVVKKWCEAGMLVNYRLPGSSDRRITVEEFLAFLGREGIPLPRSMATTRAVLWVSPDPPPEFLSWESSHAPDLFTAGTSGAAMRPQAIALDFALGRSACLAVARSLAAATAGPLLACVHYDDETAQGELSSLFGLVSNSRVLLAGMLDSLPT